MSDKPLYLCHVAICGTVESSLKFLSNLHFDQDSSKYPIAKQKGDLSNGCYFGFLKKLVSAVKNLKTAVLHTFYKVPRNFRWCVGHNLTRSSFGTTSTTVHQRRFVHVDHAYKGLEFGSFFISNTSCFGCC